MKSIVYNGHYNTLIHYEHCTIQYTLYRSIIHYTYTVYNIHYSCIRIVYGHWAIPCKVTYTLHKKSQLIGQPIKELE